MWQIVNENWVKKVDKLMTICWQIVTLPRICKCLDHLASICQIRIWQFVDKLSCNLSHLSSSTCRNCDKLSNTPEPAKSVANLGPDQPFITCHGHPPHTVTGGYRGGHICPVPVPISGAVTHIKVELGACACACMRCACACVCVRVVIVCGTEKYRGRERSKCREWD